MVWEMQNPHVHAHNSMSFSSSMRVLVSEDVWKSKLGEKNDRLKNRMIPEIPKGSQTWKYHVFVIVVGPLNVDVKLARSFIVHSFVLNSFHVLSILLNMPFSHLMGFLYAFMFFCFSSGPCAFHLMSVHVLSEAF